MIDFVTICNNQNYLSKMFKKNPQLYKIEVVCPFCLENTKRWKMILCGVEWNVNHTRLELEAVNVKEANAFEQSVLQGHLDNCIMRDYISSYALMGYGLKINEYQSV